MALLTPPRGCEVSTASAHFSKCSPAGRHVLTEVWRVPDGELTGARPDCAAGPRSLPRPVPARFPPRPRKTNHDRLSPADSERVTTPTSAILRDSHGYQHLLHHCCHRHRASPPVARCVSDDRWTIRGDRGRCALVGLDGPSIPACRTGRLASQNRACASGRAPEDPCSERNHP